MALELHCGVVFLLATPGMNCAEREWGGGLHPRSLCGHLALVTKPVP